MKASKMELPMNACFFEMQRECNDNYITPDIEKHEYRVSPIIRTTVIFKNDFSISPASPRITLTG